MGRIDNAAPSRKKAIRLFVIDARTFLLKRFCEMSQVLKSKDFVSLVGVETEYIMNNINGSDLLSDLKPATVLKWVDIPNGMFFNKAYEFRFVCDF